MARVYSKNNEAKKSPTIRSTIAKHRKMLLQCSPATHSEAYRYEAARGKMEPEAAEIESRNRYKTVLEYSQHQTELIAVLTR